MLSEPLAITVDSVAQSLPAISREKYSSTYRAVDASVGTLFRTVKISHQLGNRARREIRLDLEKIAVDALTTENFRASASIYLVINEPISGFTDAELINEVAGFLGFTNGTTVGKVLGGES